MRDSEFVEHCITQTQNQDRGRLLYLLTMAKILLIPGFVETGFYALHYQYLTLKPNFTADFVGVSSEPSNNGQQGATFDQMPLTREQFCNYSSTGNIINPVPGIETWYGTK